ncbi:ribosomal protein L19, partial [Ostreococcus tauri]
MIFVSNHHPLGKRHRHHPPQTPSRAARALRARVDMSAAVSFTRERAAVVASATKRATSYAHTNRKGLAAFVERASAKQMKGDLIPFRVGMTLKVGVTVAEGNKTRVQPYEGVVIAIHRAGVATTVTVRKTMQGFGVERVFPVHSPLCTFEEIRGAGKPVVRHFISLTMRARRRFSHPSQVRRAKLFYLRKLVGKQAKLKTRFLNPTRFVPPHASTPHAWTMTVTLRSSDDETFVVDDDVALCVARRPRRDARAET